jgi:hypothetical protein
MKMNTTIPILAVVAVVVVAAGVASAVALAAGGARTHSALVIRHQLRGCHAWSVNGGAFKPSQTVTLHRGGWISVTNNDVMPHQLVKTSGPAVTITRLGAGTAAKGMGLKGNFPPAMLARMGAAARLTFSKVGVYRLTTKAGEDYMPGIKTTGSDNVLKLTVVVS